MNLHYRIVRRGGEIFERDAVAPPVGEFSGATMTPIVILHGLFGSGDNWQTVAKQIDAEAAVVLPDLPNHGESPHTESFTLEETAEQVYGFLGSLGINRCILAGHSLGGKVAMLIAMQNPDLVSRLCIVDIAPKRYPPRHEAIIEAMREVETAGVHSRSEADSIMADMIPESKVRAFLLKSLVPRDDGVYRWRVNLHLIDRDYDQIVGWPERDTTYTEETLFIGGGDSNYVSDADLSLIHTYFPTAVLTEIPEAGHWLHAEKPREFLAVFRPFVTGNSTAA